MRELLEADEVFSLIVNARGSEAKHLKAKDDTVSFRLTRFDLFVLYLEGEEETIEIPAQEPVDEPSADIITADGEDEITADGEDEITADGEDAIAALTEEAATSVSDESEPSEQSLELSALTGELSPAATEGLDTSLASAPVSVTQSAAVAAAASYRMEQETVYLKDILSALNISVKNNTKLSVTPAGLVTLSADTYKNKNKDRITLTANTYFNEATLTIGKQTVTLSYPDPDAVELIDYSSSDPLKPEAPADAIWANDVLYLTGKMPGNAVVDCVPVEIEIDGEYVIAAYDIKIYANANQKAKGKQWQPNGNKVQVHFFAAESEDAVHVYHMADGTTTAQLVDTVTPNDGWVAFDAEHFSTYGFSFFEDLLKQTLDAALNKLLYKDTVFENDEIILTGNLPRNAIIEAKKVDVEIEGQDSILAYDIKIYQNSFFKLLGIVWQPKEGNPISVKVKSDAFAGRENVSIYHMADENAEPEFVTSVSVEDESVVFTAESFSIYPIVDDDVGGNARIAYRFWYYNGLSEKYEEITTQYFRYSDVQVQGRKIYDPSIPGISHSEMVEIFEGWHKGTVSDTNVTLQDPAVTVAALNTELQQKTEDQFVEPTVIDIIAKLKSAYYITYVDVNPSSIISTDLVVKAESGDTTFEVKRGIKPTRYEEKLLGWRLLEEIADDGAELYESGNSYTITKNITLAPVINGGFWLVFDDNDLVDDGRGNMVSGGASYTPPSFYMNNSTEQQATVQPPDPEWTGYQFGGWYEDAACTTPFTFGAYLTKNTTVHAKWIPAASSYTVIIWKQPTDPKASSYDFDRSYRIGVDNEGNLTGTIKTGDLVYLDPQYTGIYGADGTSTDLDKQYFVYNQDKTDQYIIVKANGSSVLNVYYDRVPMTITFYTWGNGYVYTETTSNDGTQYGIVDGKYVQLIHEDGEDTVYSYSYSPTYTATTNDNGEQYGIIDGEYKLLDREANTAYRTYYTFTPTTGTNGTQYGVVNGEFEELSYGYTYTWTGTGYEYEPTTADTGTQYGLVNGEYVQLSKDTVYSYDWTYETGGWFGSSTADYDGNLYTYSNGFVDSGYTTSTRFIYPIPTTYYRNSYNNYTITATRGTASSTQVWVDPNGAEYTGTRYTRIESTGTHEYNGPYYYNNRGYYYQVSDYYLDYYYNNYGLYALVDGEYHELTRTGPNWTVNSTGASYTGNRYTRGRNNNGDYNYTGNRYTRTGSASPYEYNQTVAHGGTQYGVVTADNGHVQLEATTSSYTYSYNGEEYTGTRYYVPNNNPVSYTGTRYTLDNGVYHATDENAVNGMYGRDANGVFRSLTVTTSHPKLWTYIDEGGNTVPYDGTRYTRSANQQASWQLYKQFVGVYGATLAQYGYTWPDEYWWYEDGYGTGGNKTATYNSPAGTASGTRMTLKTTFEPLDNNLDQKYYGGPTNTSARYIRFLKEQLDGSYVEADLVYTTGNGGFNVNDKYTGFHAATYRVNGSGEWKSVGTKNPSNGIYGSTISYSNYLEVRYDRTNYDLVFFPDPGSGAEPITYNLPYETPLNSYANQSPGQKLGHYFLGWYADDAYTTPFNFNEKMPDHPVSVYGYWRMVRVRVVFVPGADNVYIDPSQSLSFRLNYDEQINGSMLEAATRTGYTLDGWYTDPNFTNRWMFSTPVNSNTEGVDMTYQTAARWASARESYGDNTEQYSNVRGILVLYAKWIINTNEKGVNIVYDPGIAALYDGMGYLSTTIPIDPRLYQNGSDIVVGAAPNDYSELYYFDYWEVVDSSGNVVTVNGVSSFSPGTTFNVNNVSDQDAYKITRDENGDVLIKTIKLRAHYTRSEEAAARYTTITYDGNTLTDSIYPDGSQTLHGKARDGSLRLSVTLDAEVNTTIILKNEDDFYLDGYTLVGWSFFDGTYDEQISKANAWNAEPEHDKQQVIVKFDPAARVAADGLTQNPVNNDENVLYAMWKPKTYTVRVNQVVEDGVPVQSFTYNYKSGVENALGTATSALTLNGTDSVLFTNLTREPSVEFQYYGRLGHVFNITTPTIAENADYAVRVSATVLRDDGTLETLNPNSYGNYEILGDVQITYTYALKVPVTLEKRALNNNALLTGSKFLLTPVQWNADIQRWVQVGTTTFTYDMSSRSSMMQRLQEGVYRVEETQAPTDFAMMGEPLLLTVRKNEAFIIRTTTGEKVSQNVAKLTGSDSHTLTIFDRPIQTVTIKKLVDGQNLETTGYTFSVQLSLEGSPMRSYDTVGSGLAADTTNSAGIIEFKLNHNGTKSLRIPWGSVIQITENEYVQFAISTASDQNVTDLDTENGRIYRCTVEKDDTVTFTNKNVLLTVSKEVTGFGDKNKAFSFTLSGLTAGKIYHLTVADSAITRTSSADGKITFELKHGQSMAIPLIEGGNYTVTEAEYSEYWTSVKLNSGTSEKVSEKSLTLSAASTVAFTNYLPPPAPTGINSDTKPFGTLFLFGGLFAILSLFLVKRRKRWMEDDEPDPDGGQGRAIAPPPSGGALPGERAIAPPGVAASPKGEDKTAKGQSPQAAEQTAPISEAPKKAGTASSSPGRGAAAREIGRRAREKILSQVILTRIRGWPAARGDPAPIPRSRSGTNRLLREGG